MKTVKWLTMKKSKWLYILLLIPTLTELLETGVFPYSPRDFSTDVIMTIIIAFGIFIIRKREKELLQMSFTDGLTGIRNRRAFQEYLIREVSITQRLHLSLALIIIDLDKFKSVNDKYGHAEGDRVLVDVAKILTRSVRHHFDLCYRIGGDEFALILSFADSQGNKAIKRKVSSLKESIYRMLVLYGAGVSIGLTEFREGDTPESILKRADRFMYEQKQGIHLSRKNTNGNYYQPFSIVHKDNSMVS